MKNLLLLVFVVLFSCQISSVKKNDNVSESVMSDANQTKELTFEKYILSIPKSPINFQDYEKYFVDCKE